MRTVTEKRTLTAGDSPLAERLLLITGYQSITTYTEWNEEGEELDRDTDGLEFPDKHEDCWFSVLGDNSMGSIVDIWNNDEGQLIVEADYGDSGRSVFNLSTAEHLYIQKITTV